jgi:hypothetical protein
MRERHRTHESLRRLQQHRWIVQAKCFGVSDRSAPDWVSSQWKTAPSSAVEEVLNTHLSDSYDRVVFTEQCNRVFEQMLDYAS